MAGEGVSPQDVLGPGAVSRSCPPAFCGKVAVRARRNRLWNTSSGLQGSLEEPSPGVEYRSFHVIRKGQCQRAGLPSKELVGTISLYPSRFSPRHPVRGDTGKAGLAGTG